MTCKSKALEWVIAAEAEDPEKYSDEERKYSMNSW